MEHQVDRSVLDAFAYGFFAMCLVTSVFIAFRIRLRGDRLTTSDRITAHRWCIGTVVLIAAYFVSLGIVVHEMRTVFLGFILPCGFVAMDFRALRTLRILEASKTPEQKEIEAEAAQFRN